MRPNVPEGAIGQDTPSSSSGAAGTGVLGTLSDPPSMDEPTGDGQYSSQCVSEYGALRSLPGRRSLRARPC
jgi:hypothetical protein